MLLKKGLSIILFFLLACNTGFANDSLIHQLLVRIEYLQSNQDSYFPQGLFPSYREYAKNRGRLKKDDNIFYTGLIAFTLQRLRLDLSKEDEIICDTILARTRRIAPIFKNAEGRSTYNFWRTNPPEIFPNGGWINWFDKSKALPDDLDDTAIMLLALDADSSIVANVHELMQEFTNKKKNRVNSLKDYKQYEAYSCWFGKKMMVELDACTIANILYMVQQYNLNWTKADSACLQFLVHMIDKKDHVKYPDIMSVYYKKTSIILYHLSRLMSVKPIAELEAYKPQLIQEAKDEYKKSNDLVEKAMLRSALLQWNEDMPAEITMVNSNLINETESSDLVFFIANLACTLPKTFAYLLVNAGISKFYFYCPAYNDALLLEYLVLQKDYSQKHTM